MSGIFNVVFEGVEGEMLMLVLCDLVVVFGSVCNFVLVVFFYVVKSLGLLDDLVLVVVCFLFGRFIIEEEIDFII